MSVFAENVAIEHGESPTDFLKGRWSCWYLAALSAGWVRTFGQIVYLDPDNQDTDDFHPSHAVVVGTKDTKIRSKMAKQYEWIIAPPNRYQRPD
jgi:hypothetical protein